MTQDLIGFYILFTDLAIFQRFSVVPQRMFPEKLKTELFNVSIYLYFK